MLSNTYYKLVLKASPCDEKMQMNPIFTLLSPVKVIHPMEKFLDSLQFTLKKNFYVLQYVQSPCCVLPTKRDLLIEHVSVRASLPQRAQKRLRSSALCLL